MSSAGTIGVLEPGEWGAGSVGHVLWVERVNSDGSIQISEYNWDQSVCTYNSRTISSNKLPSSFIYLNSSCGGSDVNISNQTINGPLSCSASNSITISPSTTIQSGNGTVRFYIQ